MRTAQLFACGTALIIASFNMARADVVATCGASKGRAYYVPGPLVPEVKAGWVDDGISNGSFQLIRNGDQYDIIYTDVSNGTVSARAEGGEIVAMPTPSGDFVLVVAYGRVIENYVFWLSQPTPFVSYSQAKAGTLIEKHSLMVAACRLGR